MDYGPAAREPSAPWRTFAPGPVGFAVGPSHARPLHDDRVVQPGWLLWGAARCGSQRMTTTEDRQWLDLARSGDRAAFGKLIRQHQQRIHRLALHLTGNAGEADDVTQETFLRAYRAIARFDGRADLFTWLYRICVNVALNLRRQRKRATTDLDDPRVPEPVADAPGSDPSVAASQAQTYRELARAMDGLTEALRVTLVLACIDQLPYAEIAQSLGCSEGTVAWRVHEARRRLREAMADDAVERIEGVNAARTSGAGGAETSASRGDAVAAVARGGRGGGRGRGA
jgi:RNA polymerase sigma-70 factor (ECF subfamily)